MSGKSGIEWTDRVWNPVTGCTRVSAGCDHCYAFQLHDQRHLAWKRGTMPNAAPQYHVPFSQVQVLDEKRLLEPLSWKEPCRCFVVSMGDPFHEAVPDEHLDRMFAVMALTPHIQYQLLTKRPERMREYLTSVRQGTNIFYVDANGIERPQEEAQRRILYAYLEMIETGKVAASTLNAAADWWPDHYGEHLEGAGFMPIWPLPNVWLGVSVEDQAAADARIPVLLETPAAVRFLSCEPLLGPVRLPILALEPQLGNTKAKMNGHFAEKASRWNRGIDWVIVGGESGPHARPCNIAWIREVVRQCQAAAVPVFVKQLGSKPIAVQPAEPGWVRSNNAQGRDTPPTPLKLKHRHGGDIAEFPPDLQVREWPR